MAIFAYLRIIDVICKIVIQLTSAMTKKILTTVLLSVMMLTSTAQNSQTRQRIYLNGRWAYALHPTSADIAGKTLTDSLTLPGTTDTNGVGLPPATTTETTHLTRLHSFVGEAVYVKDIEIPKEWKHKTIKLMMERTKPTVVYVDGRRVGENDDISTSQRYDLTSALKPGRHRIAIVVDNSDKRVPPQLISNSHAYTEDTQTNWNGIIGDFYLEATDALHIADLQLHPDAVNKTIEVTLTLSGKVKKGQHIYLQAVPDNWHGLIKSIDLWTVKGQCQYTITIPLGDEAQQWDEHHNRLYVLSAIVDQHDELVKPFGLVDFRVSDHHFMANGREVFLRGKHDACVFPLMAHVPMDKEAWIKYLKKNKKYGINHIRFHSWCPPEAAFEAADELGIYLQPELPFWGDFKADDERLMTFLHKEGEHILHDYGHHPSFVMFALGNELWGSIEKMKEFVDDFRLLAPRKLFTFGSNYYLGYQGVKSGMDYFTTCRVGGEAWGEFNTHTRGSFSFADTYDGGIINHCVPSTTINFQQACALSTVPVISHETAQFQTYPDYDEIHKYTGVLYPYNMQVFYKRLVQAGLASQAKDFHRASGLWSLQLYKADVEMDMRTPNMAGFQLLDLQDYPGQGSAYVGLLDAFMDEKPFMNEYNGHAIWNSFCREVTPLLETEKYCYSSDETLRGHVKLFNYSAGEGFTAWHHGMVAWKITDSEGRTWKKGRLELPRDCHGLIDVGDMAFPLHDIDRPMRLNLHLYAYLSDVNGVSYDNSYPIWVYPAQNDLERVKKDIIITHDINTDVMQQLEAGARVLWMPDTTAWKGHVVGGLFQTDYWNYRMFKTISENNKRPVSPGTLGILTDPKHPLFSLFPTEMHTNWQWFPIIKASSPMILDALPGDYRPIVQVIDNIERNHRLGLVFEFAVGKGKLLVCMADLDRASARPEGRQFYLSLLHYMQSDHFAPTVQYTASELLDLLRQEPREIKLEELNNISPY